MRMSALVVAAVLGVGAAAPEPALLTTSSTGARALQGLDEPVAQPNLVVVLADDMREDDLAYMPYVRRFFSKGLHFRNSFSNNPMCCPARASILTGRYSHNHHVVTVDPPWGFGAFDDSVTVATALKAAGYQTGYAGKYLNGYGVQRSKVTGHDSSRYVPPGWDRWRASLDDNSAGVPGGTYKYFDTTLNVDGRIVRNQGRYSTNLIFDHSRALVDAFHQKEQPFFLYVNPVAPHFGGPREPDDPKVLAHFTPARPAWVKGRFDRMLRKSPGVPRFGVSPERDVSDKTWPTRSLPDLDLRRHRAVRELARQRAEALYVVDREFRRLVRTLAATGELADTVVVFSSDNGHFLGEHRKLTGKLLPYEPSFRVPMLVRAPGGARGDRVGPVGSVDLGVTLLDLAGATEQLPLKVDGRSFAPLVYGDDRPWDTPAYYEAVVGAMNADRPGLSGFGLRTSRWKFVLYDNGKRELYDLVRDPHELSNLVLTGRRRPDVLADLTRITRKLKRCQGRDCRALLPRRYRRTVAQARKDLASQERAAWFRP
jgi:N-acetylglucosamine-6-sulfatase